jgi:hypothetical protein
MREATLTGYHGDAARPERGHATASAAADWLGLAAAPTFAAMALLSAFGGQTDILCGGASPLSGMTAMYLLMTAFHTRPWLTLVANRNP